MKSLKNIFYISLMGIIGASCSDELQTSQPLTNGDFLTINLEMADEVVVHSRAEDTFNNLGVYIFNEAGTQLLQYEEFTGSGKTASIGLNDDVKGVAKKVYVVANATGLSKTPESVTALEALAVTANNGVVSSDAFVMSGTSQVAANVTSTNVNLIRLAAKVSVESSLTSYSIENFEVHNPANTALIGAPNAATFPVNSTYTVTSAGSGTSNPVYVYPSQSEEPASNGNDKAFVVVKAKNTKTSVESYYRLNLIKDKEVLNILPNHYIQIEITQINGDGYATAAEAIQHPELQGSVISALIHDHASGVYSMVTDGYRELGTPEEIVWDPTQNTTSFTVKWYSPSEDEMKVKPVVTQLSGTDWLKCEVTENSEVTSTENSSNADTDNPGHRITYTLTITGSSPAWDTEAEIKVNWQGLERIVKVVYNATFNPADILSSTKLVYGTNNTIENYWSFLTSTLKGATEAAMGEGLDRTNGFHFPMYYDNGREYSYQIEFNATKFNNKITNVAVTAKGDAPISTANMKWTYAATGASTLSFNCPAANKYTYAVGTLTFVITYSDASNQALTANIDVPVYHTGLFWQHPSTNSEITTGWYYYEVVPMAGSNDSKYWLDRNIGATSRLNYVEASTPALTDGDENAKGALIHYGNYGSYSSPTQAANICPAGFHIPTKTEWDAVRTSANFKTNQETLGSTTVYTTYFDSTVGTIYFPKSRFRNNGDQAGDDGSGYYLSCTESSGLEKDQIGRWVNALYLSGGSNTWINADVQNHRMSVRAVAGASAPAETKKTISFNVQNATHVYIYDTTPGNGLFTFPGKAVCTATTAKSGVATNFSYTTTSDPSNLKIYLVMMEDSGKITVYSDNGKMSASEATGIAYSQGKTYYVSGSKTAVK